MLFLRFPYGRSVFVLRSNVTKQEFDSCLNDFLNKYEEDHFSNDTTSLKNLIDFDIKLSSESNESGSIESLELSDEDIFDHILENIMSTIRKLVRDNFKDYLGRDIYRNEWLVYTISEKYYS